MARPNRPDPHLVHCFDRPATPISNHLPTLTFHQRRDYLLDLFSSQLGLPAVVPDGAFYTMLNVSSYGSSLTVAERLLDHGVVTIPGSAFGAESEDFLRISFCADNAKLAEGVSRIKKALSAQVGAKS